MYGKIRNCLKGVYIRKMTPRCVHWLFICVLCCYIHWIQFNLVVHWSSQFYLGFALHYVCTDVFLFQ